MTNPQELKEKIEAHFERYPFVKKQMTGGLLLEALSALTQWVSFADESPPLSQAKDDQSVETTDKVIVTNNINARDRMGRMSHTWLLAPIKSADGSWVGFDSADCKIHGLTHWLRNSVPTPPLDNKE